MFKFLLVFIMLLCCGCQSSFTNPATGTVYKGSIDSDGVGLVVTPPFWEYLFNAFNLFKEEEEEVKATPEKE